MPPAPLSIPPSLNKQPEHTINQRRQPGTLLSAGHHVGNCDRCGEVRLLDMRNMMDRPNADL